MREAIVDTHGASLLRDGCIKLLEKVCVEKKKGKTGRFSEIWVDTRRAYLLSSSRHTKTPDQNPKPLSFVGILIKGA